jgi:hypothetical protein
MLDCKLLLSALSIRSKGNKCWATRTNCMRHTMDVPHVLCSRYSSSQNWQYYGPWYTANFELLLLKRCVEVVDVGFSKVQHTDSMRVEQKRGNFRISPQETDGLEEGVGCMNTFLSLLFCFSSLHTSSFLLMLKRVSCWLMISPSPHFRKSFSQTSIPPDYIWERIPSPAVQTTSK